MPQKIDVYSIMRNEVRMVPYFLRHYETLASRILVWDDQSDDGTTELLSAHPKVTVLPLEHHGADDVYYVRELWPQYRERSRGVADWVMCVDADEFVWHPRLASYLEELTSLGVKKIRCDGYTMWSATFPTTEGQIYDEIRYGTPDRWSTKTVVINPDIHITWAKGRHSCMPSRNVRTHADTGIKLLHFRYLGTPYFDERTRKNYANMGLKYNEQKHHNLPDGSRGPLLPWYESAKSRLKRIIS